MSEKRSWKDHAGDVLDTVKGYDVIECDACGFKHVVPIPDPEEMARYYSEEFIARRPKIVERVREDLDWWKLTYSKRLDLLEKHLKGNGRRMLDIGCGLGFFLKEASARSWDALGIEPSKQAYDHAFGLGVNVVNDILDEGNYDKLGRFNAIHMNEVLEHLSDPAMVLRISWDMLEPDGLILVISPNDYNPFQTALRRHLGFEPWWVAPPEHINYFDFDSLYSLLDRTGYDVVAKSTTFPMELFLLMGDNYVGDDKLGRECHGKRKNMEMNLEKGMMNGFQKQFSDFLSDCGVGREAVVLGKKRDRNPSFSSRVSGG